jgi:hypothetical protein
VVEGVGVVVGVPERWGAAPTAIKPAQ